MEKLGIKVVVAERHGMRRFLYPLRVKLPSLYRRLVGSLALADERGSLIPTHVETNALGEVSCLFAVSLAPFQSRDLLLVRINPDAAIPPIPDALQISENEDGFTSHQERVEFEVGSLAQLGSVIYDGQQHLSGPLSITLDGHPVEPIGADYRPKLSGTLRGGSGALFTYDGIYGADTALQPTGATEVELTACKSWVWVRHSLTDAQPGSILRFNLPLTVTSPVQTCDFGAGNGAYGKIEPDMIDEIAWDVDLSDWRYARYAIQSHLERTDEARIDYAGEIKGNGEVASKLWLHWIEPTKSVALAVTHYPKSCSSIVFRLNDRGIVAVEFEVGERSAAPLAFGLCYHFLNAVPAIAAATNPASILLPPSVTATRSLP